MYKLSFITIQMFIIYTEHFIIDKQITKDLKIKHKFWLVLFIKHREIEYVQIHWPLGKIMHNKFYFVFYAYNN